MRLYQKKKKQQIGLGFVEGGPSSVHFFLKFTREDYKKQFRNANDSHIKEANLTFQIYANALRSFYFDVILIKLIKKINGQTFTAFKLASTPTT